MLAVLADSDLGYFLLTIRIEFLSSLQRRGDPENGISGRQRRLASISSSDKPPMNAANCRRVAAAPDGSATSAAENATSAPPPPAAPSPGRHWVQDSGFRV